MARRPKPWFWKARDAWYVTIGGIRYPLGHDKDEAYDRFYALMQQPQQPKISAESLAAVADAFLEWVSKNRCAETFEWYIQNPLLEGLASMLAWSHQLQGSYYRAMELAEYVLKKDPKNSQAQKIYEECLSALKTKLSAVGDPLSRTISPPEPDNPTNPQ